MPQHPTMVNTTSSAEHYGGPGSPAPNSLWQWFTEAESFREASNAFAPALCALHQPGDHLSGLLSAGHPAQPKGHFKWTYSEFLTATESLAALWGLAGVQKGDSVFTFVTNSAEWALFFWTSMRMGTIFVPLDPNTVKRKDEITNLIKMLRPTVVLAQDSETAALYEGHSGGEDSARFKVFGQGDFHRGWKHLASLKREPGLQAPPVTIADDPDTAICLIMFTSGTTNLPKGCPISVSGMAAQIGQYHHSIEPTSWTPEARMLINTNNFRPICYLACMNAWKAGGSVTFPSATFSPATSLEALRQEGCTHTWFVPAQLSMISSLPMKEENKPSAIKVVITSGDLADEALLYKAKEALRPMKVVPSWGMSECAPLMGYRNDEPAPRYRSGLAGVGRALQGTCVKIAENGTETAARKGEHGDLHVTSQALIRSYLRNAKPEDFYDDPEGKRWFKTGDVAVMEDDGVVFVVGRTKDVIKCKGFGIVPSIMERCLDDFFRVEVSLSSDPRRVSLMLMSCYCRARFSVWTMKCMERSQSW